MFNLFGDDFEKTFFRHLYQFVDVGLATRKASVLSGRLHVYANEQYGLQ